MPRWNNKLQINDEIVRYKRDAVMRESGRLFNEKGYHNTSLDDIATALAVSKGTLYNYVSDKQEILFAFHQMGLELGERAAGLAEASDLDGANKMRLAVSTFIAEVTEQLGGYGVIAEIGALKPSDRKVIVARREQLDRRFRSIVEQGMKDGSLRDVDPKMLVFTMLGALQLIPNWFSPHGRLSGPEVADAITDILLYGLATPDASPG